MTNRERDDILVGKRRELLSQMWAKYNKYGWFLFLALLNNVFALCQATLLTHAQDLMSFSSPRNRDYRTVKTLFDKCDPVSEYESYIYHQEDILSLKTDRDNAWLDADIQEFLERYDCRLPRVSSLTPCTTETRTNMIPVEVAFFAC